LKLFGAFGNNNIEDDKKIELEEGKKLR